MTIFFHSGKPTDRQKSRAFVPLASSHLGCAIRKQAYLEGAFCKKKKHLSAVFNSALEIGTKNPWNAAAAVLSSPERSFWHS